MTAISTNFDSLRNADQLGGALQQGLPRPMNPKLTWSLLRTLILGGLTGGIAAVWALPGAFNRFVESEQMQYWHLAEWLRLRGAPESEVATRLANEMKPAFWLPLAARLFAIVAIGIGITAVRAEHQPAVTPWQAWSQLIWSRVEQRPDGRHHKVHAETFKNFLTVDRANGETVGVSAETNPAARTPKDLILPFNLAILGGCLCWLMQINGHIGRAKKFVGAFNHASGRFGVGAVHPPSWNVGIRPVWLGSGILLAAIGGYWAVPMMLAAAAQRSYIIHATRRVRSDLARRQRDVLLAQRPPVHVPASEYLLGQCPQPNCHAPLPPEAQFCRRCGTRLNRASASRGV